MSADAAWAALEAAGAVARERRIDSLFAAEPDRLKRLSLSAAGLDIDLSKQPWSLADLGIALDLARAAGVEPAREALFGGEMVNLSEGRPALHMALRAPDGADFKALGKPISPIVEATRNAVAAYAESVRREGRIRAVVSIGIGGSDLGPRLMWEALRPLRPAIDLRFVANVDPNELAQAVTGLDPASTLVVVISKTFTTQETLANAEAARAWLRAALGEAGDANLVAVSAAPDRAWAFGVPDGQVFPFWDWVGGRYSLWSAVGLPCVIGLGAEAMAALHAGAHAMDRHFREASLEANAPVLLALAHVFNRNGMGRPLRGVIPYAQRLRLLPSYLQQLEMESGGKQVEISGAAVARATAASVFGDAGTNGQHAYFQLLHQGTDVVPLDILAVAKNSEGDPAAQRKLLANAVAQAEALMVGRDGGDEPHRHFPGSRPSSFILLDALDPVRLGALLALYEHKTFVESVLWRINPFDQWGVELGKTLAGRVLAELEGGPPGPHDPSTAALIGKLRG